MRANRRGVMLGAAALTGALAPTLASASGALSRRRVRERVDSHQPIVETASGRIRGYRTDDVNAFLGVPYGAPTNGANRFRRARPPESWSGVRDVLAYGPMCPFAPPSFERPGERAFGGPQDDFVLYRNWTPHSPGEDCLRLNVWAPASPGRRPVMVYMHGGGYFAGSGNDLPAYDGAHLAARHDVVVVTHNHRLNLFGYLDLSRFGGAWSEASNLGMFDIVAVLQWVRANIESFGGDPNNVTIFGQSGGGGKVGALLAMPDARGLFHKAIVQSGSPGLMASLSQEQAAMLSDSVLQRLGVTAGNLDRLQEMEAEQLAGLAIAEMMRWSPVVGGASLPIEPASPVPAAFANGVPFLVGTNLNEMANSIDNPLVDTFSEADLNREARAKYGAAGPDVAAAYRRSYPELPLIEVWGAMEAAVIRESAFRHAQNAALAGCRAWEYLFAWRSPVLEGKGGVYHSAEIAFVFDNADLCVNQTGGGDDALALAGQMSSAWAAFARNGDPNYRGLPRWPEFRERNATMVFDDPCRVVHDPEAEGRRLM